MSKPGQLNPTPKPRILITEGPWGIRENTNFLSSFAGMSNGYDIVTHVCPWKKNWFKKTWDVPSSYMKQDDTVCLHCDEPVPSMIKTLWTLKNMDKIQADVSYGNPISGTFYGIWTIRPGQVFEYDPKKVKL